MPPKPSLPKNSIYLTEQPASLPLSSADGVPSLLDESQLEEGCSYVCRWIVHFRRALIIVLSPMLLSLIFLAGLGKEVRCAFVVFWMAVYWMCEVIPLSATAFFPVVLFPLLGILPASEVAPHYLKDSCFLFIGSLLVAVAVEESGLHERMALRVLLITGCNPRRLLLGFQLSTALLSMWLSNTATTALMLPTALAIVDEMKHFDKTHADLKKSALKHEKFAKALLLSICYSANIGGIGTLTGTSTNIVLTGQMQTLYPSQDQVSFVSWMVYALPVVLVCLLLCWLWLQFWFIGFGSCFKRSPSQSSPSPGHLSPQTSLPPPVHVVVHKQQPIALPDELNTRNYQKSAKAVSAFYPKMAAMTTAECDDDYDLFCQSTPKTTDHEHRMSERKHKQPANTRRARGIVDINMSPPDYLKGHSVVQVPEADSEEPEELLINEDAIIRRKYEELGVLSFHELSVLCVFVLLTLLWFFREPKSFPGWSEFMFTGYVSDGTVAMFVAVLLFLLPKRWPSRNDLGVVDGSTDDPNALLTWSLVKQRFEWGPVLLVGGGYAMAAGVRSSGLSDLLGAQLHTLIDLPQWLFISIAVFLSSFMTEVSSNAASASIFLPVMASLADRAELNPLLYLLPVSVACSFAFMLPVAHPTNSIVFSANVLTIRDMAFCGLGLKLICVCLTVVHTYSWGYWIFDFDTVPAWANTTVLI